MLTYNFMQADAETQLNFHSYLRQHPLDGFRPEAYPISDLMKQKRIDAMCAQSWFEAWSSGGWTPDYDDNDDNLGNVGNELGNFTPGQFYPSASLANLFSQWAADHAPACASLTERQFFDKLAAFARTATDRIKGPMNVRHCNVQTKGYKMAIDHGQFSQAAHAAA